MSRLIYERHQRKSATIQKNFKDHLWKTSMHASNQKCAHGLHTIVQVFIIFVLVNIRIARSFQGQPTWPYLARPNMHPNMHIWHIWHIWQYLAYLGIFGIFGLFLFCPTIAHISHYRHYQWLRTFFKPSYLLAKKSGLPFSKLSRSFFKKNRVFFGIVFWEWAIVSLVERS